MSKKSPSMSRLFFVDCEAGADGRQLREFGAVHYITRATFHGKRTDEYPHWYDVFQAFEKWLKAYCGDQRPVFVSDNPAYDWQSINAMFHDLLGVNPFGHSARRISDFYAGLNNNFWNSTGWKRLRVTAHSHHPVEDALGNCEAFARIMAGER